jgi:L-serine dehydratase
MGISIFDLFSIGIGPSSSHTVGPMVAANDFVKRLEEKGLLEKTTHFQVHVFGSLAHTGEGHGTDVAILNGLEGKEPETVNAQMLRPRFEEICENKELMLGGTHRMHFNFERDYQIHKDIFLEKHSNGMKLIAMHEVTKIDSEIYFSIGGGFIVTEDNFGKEESSATAVTQPFPFQNGEDLLQMCDRENRTIAEIMLENEKAFRTEQEIIDGIKHIVQVMEKCIEDGLIARGFLPGGLNVKRRAGELYQKLQAKSGIKSKHEDADVMNWLSCHDRIDSQAPSSLRGAC